MAAVYLCDGDKIRPVIEFFKRLHVNRQRRKQMTDDEDDDDDDDESGSSLASGINKWHLSYC